MTKTLCIYTFVIGVFMHPIFSAGEPFLDKYVEAGMNDPHSLAVCRIIGVCDVNGEQRQNVATGSLVNLNGQIVVLTVAHMLNPTTVEFFKSFSEDPLNYSISVHKVKSKKSLWEGVNGPDTTDLQLLFLDQNPEDVKPLEFASTNDLTSSLKTIGYGTYFTQYDTKTNRYTSKIQKFMPVKVVFDPLKTTGFNEGSSVFRTITRHNPDSLETHTFKGFSGAPVINSCGEIVSIITTALDPIEVALPKEKDIIISRNASALLVMGLITTGAFQKWPSNNIIRSLLGGWAVCGIINALVQHSKLKINGGSIHLLEFLLLERDNLCHHLNLQQPGLQAWLNEAVSAGSGE